MTNTLADAVQLLELAAAKVNEHLIELDNALDAADDPFNMDESQAQAAANSLGRELIQMRRAYEHAYSVTKRYNVLKERVALRLSNLMAVGFMTRVERRGEYKIEPRVSLKISPIGGNQDETVKQWLVDNGMGALVEPKINTNSLASGIREHIGMIVGKDKADVKISDVPDELKDLFNFYEASTVSVTGG